MTIEKKYHHGNLRQALLKAGLTILEEQGLAQLSLRKCAESVGVSHTAPKNHFGSMAGLLSAIATTGYTRLHEYMIKNMELSANSEYRRGAALTGYVNFAIDNPALYELMFSRDRINVDDPDLVASVGACYQVLAGSAQGLNWNHRDKPDADMRAQMFLWSLVHGYAQLYIAGRFKKEDMKKLGILDIMPKF